jgi:hypothetical protein
MDMEDLQKRIENLENENKILIDANIKLEAQIKKYTSNNGHKKYYQEHKDKLQEYNKQYLQKIKESNPEKLKEYRRSAYINRKAKLNLSNLSNLSNNEII